MLLFQKKQPPEQRTVTERAFAKVNLLLAVGAKRPDGYHELVSVMQTVDVYDTVTLSSGTASGVELACSGVETPPGNDNLAYRAAVKFFNFTEIVNTGVQIELSKRLPTQAGLGGGSADAAAVLRGLRTLYDPSLSDAALEEMAAELGSDVPFCVRGGTALATGRGERLTPLPPLPPCWFVLVKPPLACSTTAMYAQIDACALWETAAPDGMIAALRRGDLAGVCGAMGNTFERALPPGDVIPSIRDRLTGLGARRAMLSGSGSAVFGVFEREEDARVAAAILRGDYPDTFCGRGV